MRRWLSKLGVKFFGLIGRRRLRLFGLRLREGCRIFGVVVECVDIGRNISGESGILV